MAEFSYPNDGHNNRAVTEAEYERLVLADSTTGLIGSTPATSAIIYADGIGVREVRVRANREARVRGFYWNSGTTERTLNLSANAAGSPRYDLIVLRLTRATWEVTLEVIEGVAGSGIPAITKDLGSTGVYEIFIGIAFITPGAAVITAPNALALGWHATTDTVLCTTTSRPDPSPGLRFLETDTGIHYMYPSSGSVPIVLNRDTGWVNLAMPAGFEADHGMRVRIKDNTVYFQLSVRRTGANQGPNEYFVMAVLDAKFRPDSVTSQAYVCHGPNNNKSSVMRIGPDGQVYLFPVGDGVNGVIGNGSVASATASWPAAS